MSLHIYVYYTTYTYIYICVSVCVLVKRYAGLHGNVHVCKVQIVADYFKPRQPQLILFSHHMEGHATFRNHIFGVSNLDQSLDCVQAQVVGYSGYAHGALATVRACTHREV